MRYLLANQITKIDEWTLRCLSCILPASRIVVINQRHLRFIRKNLFMITIALSKAHLRRTLLLLEAAGLFASTGVRAN
jgi:hypothetical protein